MKESGSAAEKIILPVPPVGQQGCAVLRLCDHVRAHAASPECVGVLIEFVPFNVIKASLFRTPNKR